MRWNWVIETAAVERDRPNFFSTKIKRWFDSESESTSLLIISGRFVGKLNARDNVLLTNKKHRFCVVDECFTAPRYKK